MGTLTRDRHSCYLEAQDAGLFEVSDNSIRDGRLRWVRESPLSCWWALRNEYAVKYLEKWCEKHELLSSWFALQILPHADALIDTMREVHVRRDDLLSLANVELEEWASFYTETGEMVSKAMQIAFDDPADASETTRELRQLMLDPEPLGKESAKRLKSPARFAERVHSDRWQIAFNARTLLDAILAGDGSLEAPETISPEMVFFCAVAVPCWLRTGKSLDSVRKAAESGDEASAKLLVALDPNVVECTAIRRSILQRPEGGRRARIHRAAERGVPQIKPALVKASLAGMVDMSLRHCEAATKQLKKVFRGYNPPRLRLTGPDFQAFYDALAKDLHGLEQDGDLHDSPDSFYKALKRSQMTLWRDPSTVGQILF